MHPSRAGVMGALLLIVVVLLAMLPRDHIPSRGCGDPDKIRPMYDPYQGPFAEGPSQQGKVSTILVAQSHTPGFETYVVGWSLEDTLALFTPCLCQLAARWPGYVRWELVDPCADSV